MRIRYAFAMPEAKKLTGRFWLGRVWADLKPRYNIAPTQDVPAIFNDSGRGLSEARWGLDAKWQTHPLFNARAEAIDSKPSFRKDFELRRCLMLADSFYEWKHPSEMPFRLSLKDGKPFAFAGIYAIEDGVRTCCMITTEANSRISQVHDRMSVILPIGHGKGFMEADGKAEKGC